MTEIDKIKSLTGDEYRLYAYIRASVNEHNVVWNMTREDLERELSLSYVSVYKYIKKLQELEFIEYNGRKRKIKILK